MSGLSTVQPSPLLPRLAAGQWTDFNASDPGVTILGELGDALADAAYRAGHDIPDLLASSTVPALPPSLPSAATVLTCQPVTLTDLRRLAMDCPGVRDAWAQQADADPPLHFREALQCLTTAADHGQPLPLRGLLTVNWLPDPTSQAVTGANDAASSLNSALHAARPLGADFTALSNLKQLQIGLIGTIEIDPVDNTSSLSAAIFAAVTQCLCPRLPLSTLQQEQASGRSTDEIFQGPELQRGFPSTQALAAAPFPKEVALSALIAAIAVVPGVRAVTTLGFAKPDPNNSWFIEVPEGCYPVFDGYASADQTTTALTLTCGPVSVPCTAQAPATSSNPDEPLPQAQRDIVVPQGQDREVTAYSPLQEHLPAVYATGDGELPRSAITQRRALAHQLQGYLTLFDQLLANDLAQLGLFPSLMAFSASPPDTYAAQVLPQAQSLAWSGGLVDITREQSLHRATETEQQAIARKNRFLNHLLARFGESFGPGALLEWAKAAPGQGTATALDSAKALAAAKARLLQLYPQAGGGRGTGFDQTQPAWGTDNVGGYKLRLCCLLGIEDVTERALVTDPTTDETEGFHLVEHLLLRPRGDAGQGAFFSVAEPITAFADAGSGKVTCTSPAHGIPSGATIRILGTGLYDGERVATVVDADTFTVPGTFAVGGPLIGAWVYPGQPSDPFSNQISLVFPGWIGRFSDPTFRKFVEQTVAGQTPAHLTAYVLWMQDAAAMTGFEAALQPWLQAFGKGQPTWAQSAAVAEHLGMGCALLPGLLDTASMKFDGSGWVEVEGYLGIAGSSPRTVECWLKSSGSPDNLYLELTGWGGGTAPGSQVWELRLTNGGQIKVDAVGSVGTAKVNDGRWHHIAVVLPQKTAPTGADIAIYVDGREDPLTSKGTAGISTTQWINLRLGNDPSGPPGQSPKHLFRGQLAEMRLWSVARSAHDIRTFMNRSLHGTEAGLEGYWKLDTQPTAASPQVPDSSPHRRDGFLAPQRLPDCLDSRSLAFDGSHYLQADGYAGITGGAARTVEFWIKPSFPTGYQNFHQIIGWGAKPPSPSSGTDGATFAIRLNCNKSPAVIAVSLTDSNTLDTSAGTALPADGAWHHVAVVVPENAVASDIVFYLDGIAVTATGSTSTAVATDTTANPVMIGLAPVSTSGLSCTTPSTSAAFCGSLADVRIWNVARTTDQIAQNMNRRLTGEESGLDAYWPLAAPPVGGNPLPDGTRHGHSATPYGTDGKPATTWPTAPTVTAA